MSIVDVPKMKSFGLTHGNTIVNFMPDGNIRPISREAISNIRMNCLDAVAEIDLILELTKKE